MKKNSKKVVILGTIFLIALIILILSSFMVLKNTGYIKSNTGLLPLLKESLNKENYSMTEAKSGNLIKRVYIISSRDKISIKGSDYGTIDIHVITNDNQDLGNVGTITYSQSSSDGGKVSFDGNKIIGVSVGTVNIQATVEYGDDTVVSNTINVKIQENNELAYINSSMFKYDALKLFEYGGSVTNVNNQGIYFIDYYSDSGGSSIKYNGLNFQGSSWNRDCGNYPFETMAKSQLDQNGNIQFNVKDNGIFNENISVGKKSYLNVGIPFVRLGDNYIFDSDVYEVRFDNGNAQDNTNLLWSDQKTSYIASDGTTKRQFFPFNSGKNGENAIYHFGMKVNIPFYTTEDGKTKTGENIVFNFSGDDDVWIFIDGKLVIDLGGMHAKIESNIDFANNQVTVYVGTTDTVNKQYTLSSILGENWNSNIEQEHNLSVFYLERAKVDSNCKISYNLPMTVQQSDVLVHHYLEGTNQELAPDETIEGFPGDEYTTNRSTKVPQNYEIVSTEGEISGIIGTTRKVVTYYYKLKTPTIDSEISKTSTVNQVTDINQEIPYTINYKSNITDYIGNATVTIVDYLPYPIDINSSDINGGTYNSENNTITWEKTIYLNTYENNSVNINNNILLKYLNMNTNDQTITNTVDATIVLENPEMTDNISTSLDLRTNYTVDVTVTKIWNHTNNIYTIPNEVEILLKNGNEIVGRQVINVNNATNENTWSYTFTGLDKYNSQGNEIEYTADEEEVVSGELAYYKKEIDGLTIRNTYNGPIISTEKSTSTENGLPYVVEGERIDYTITVRNDGEIGKEVNVKDTIPEGTTLVEGSIKVNESGTYTKEQLEGEGLTVNVGGKSIGEVKFSVTVNELEEGIYEKTIRNTALVDGTSTNETTETVNKPKIIPSKTSVPENGAEVKQGDEIQYTITLDNSEGTAPEKVNVKDTVPEGTVFIPDSLKIDGVDLGYTIDDLIQGMQVNVDAQSIRNVQFKVIVQDLDNAEIIRNQAYVNDNPTNEVTHTYIEPIISAKKSIKTENNLSYVTEGEKITYTITVTNDGDLTKRVLVKDIIPEGTDFVTGSIKINNEETNYTSDDLFNGINVDVQGKKEVLIDFDVTVSENATEISNTANVDDKNTNSIDIPVVKYYKKAEIIRQTTEEISDGKVTAGDKIKYTITIENLGKETINNITVKDIIPEGTTISKIDKGQVNNNKEITWNITNLQGGQKTEVSFEVIVDYDIVDTKEITNVATVDDFETNEVETTYEKPEIKEESEISKTGVEKITAIDESISYEISYSANIKDFVGQGKITIVDTLPYPIKETGELDGGKYNPEDQTITWVEELEQIDTYLNEEYNINIQKEITINYIYSDEENLCGTMENNVSAKMELIQNGNIVKEEEKTATHITKIEIPARLIVHHYIYDEEKNEYTTVKIAEDEILTGLIGNKYYTGKATVRADYECINETPDNYEGTLTKSDTIVTYYYKLKQAQIDSKIQKEVVEPVLTVEDGEITYKITYNVSVNNYIGKLAIKLTDYLPYKINTTKYDLADGIYDAETDTINWTIERDIDTFKNGIYQETIEKEIKISYVNQDVTNPILNKIDGNMKIYYPDVHSTNPGGVRLEQTKQDSVELKQDYRVNRTVEKVWDDNENIKGRRPESVTIQLTADGETTYEDEELEKVILSELNNWTYTFEDLPKYTSEGTEIKYNVIETETNTNDLEYYEEPIIENFNDIIRVTNKYKLMDVETESSIKKIGTESITSSTQEFDYTISYSTVVKDYIGEAVITLVDNLPYKIDIEKSDLNGGIYDEKANTITWIEKIEHINTFENEDYHVEIIKPIKLVYSNLDATERTIINKVKGTIDLYETESTNTVETVFETKSEIPGKVIVKYIDKESGEEIAEGYQIDGLVGEQYSTEQKDIYGYTFVKDTQNISGNMKEGIVEVVYYYERTDAGGVIVRYVDEQGNEIARTETITGKVKDLYETLEKEIENYDFVRVEGEEKGELVEDVIKVTYIYTKIPGRVIVRHLEKDDTPENDSDNIVLAEEEIIEGYSGDSYNTQRKKIENYKVAEPEPENSIGTMTRGDIYVTYYYERKPSGIITVKYVDIDTNEEILYKNEQTEEYLSYSEQLQGLCGLEYQTTQKEIPYYNYLINMKPINDKGIYTEDNIEVIYYYKKQEFNLSIEKEITKITVNGKEHRLKENLNQIDVVSSKVAETNIEITYKIIVSNTAEIEGTATVVEKIPEYFSVVESKSKDWKTVDGNLESTITLKPGYTKELYVVLKWKNNPNNFGLQTNTVTLQNITNPANYEEELGDNTAKADVILSVKTGGVDNAIIIGIPLVVMLGALMITIYLKNKRIAK